SGVGKLILVDSDVIEITNLNRQLHTNQNNIGKLKAEAMKERALTINPDVEIFSYDMFLSEENMDFLWEHQPDYIADAIDSISSKISLITAAKKKNVPIISSMGTGNKMEPSMFQVADVYATQYCPLARVMRQELKKRGVDHLKVVYSEEQNSFHYRSPVASISFCPSVAGLLIASEIIKDLIGYPNMGAL
ncbi:tRNA threonylcarbamoyladenosine dehydratase, partial [Bacillus licheniformis]|uniref:tRNA threonylcarbamoyladenosine dehydratase n=1 Tax=Bacillus licheniformis TaxID=1402 RepID=UPI000FB144FC